MLPEGWLEGRVSNLVSALETGVSVNGENRPKKPDEKAVLKVSAVSYGCFDKNACKVISNEELKRARINPKAGRIIISRSNTGKLVGASVFIEKNYDDLFLPDKLWQMVPKSHSDMRWLSYILSSKKSRYAFSNLATGTSGSMKNITKSELLGLKIFIPPLPEQKKIARTLSTWDKAIETVEKLIKNSKTQKKALMQQLLTGKRRLPGFDKLWKKGYLGDICLFKGGSAFKEVYQGEPEGKLPFIKVSDMNLPGNSIYIKYANNWISESVAKEIKAKPFPAESVVFAKVGAALLLNKRRILEQETIIDNNMMAAIPNNDCNTNYLYQLMLTIDFAKLVQDGVVPSINQSSLSRFKIWFPKLKEQQQIAALLTTADKKTETLQQKLDCLKQEKKALMQQLLTGKRRVKVDVDG
ncbi:MAG: restriction endonuclease subunit S [Gammaproteobacteria bacterium]|nr:restriction endonuclease subunit S [Gammaproteobacteria bacterium]